MQKKITAKECRFAVHIPAMEKGGDDFHLIKEQVHYEDGSVKPNTILVKNFKRPFWVTKKGFQNHQSKKEWEDKDKLIRYETTQSNLRDSVAKALGKAWSKDQLRNLSNSPYLYGSDLLSTSQIKKMYMDRYPDVQTRYTTATFDIETDVISGKPQIIMITVAFKNKVFTAVLNEFVRGIANPEDLVNSKMKLYLQEYIEKRNIESSTVFLDNEIDLLRTAVNKAHEWMPDFLAIWNIDFDIPRVMEACERAGVDPKDIFSDPSIPPQYRYFNYKQGPKKKVTASGKVIPINPAAQWHTVFCPSSFYIIDAMCTYKHIRTGRAEEPSYSLDAILNKELGIRKLKFKEADDYQGLRWHQFMQTEFKIEYIIYNRFDCISMQELDEKTNDLSLTLPMFSGVSDFSNFKSQPKRAVDTLHFYCLTKDKVIAATGSEMEEEFDDETLGLDGWIVTLPAHLVEDNGLQCIKDQPDMRTSVRVCVADLDVSAAYPNGQICYNISKETTKKELISVEGIDEQVFRMQNINLWSGQTNAVEYCSMMFGFPRLDQLLDHFKKQNQN